ncbi:hypothetical protein [Sphingomonas sp. PR090111-T3T-6A]|uniref:hypothetical protein n=1 Tax=Sphingomonas sp. PR090111-T3T-6A TaxID=685778 RepID=UPI0003681D57|nr:hypothetical protein [Sphingomonas sp. PR090111-T3T-6A]
MRENKAFASLTSGLLARKGQARPAMRPQGFGQGVSTEDLGWNDMGYDAPRNTGPRLPVSLSGPSATPRAANVEVPEVVRQQEEIAREFAEPAPEPLAKTPPARRAPRAVKMAPVAKIDRATGRKAAFTLRLDAERHLRLRLACAVENRSAQQLVTAALDRLLDDLPEVARMAASLPHTGADATAARQD